MTAKKIGYHAILNMLTCRKKVHKNVELIQGAFHKRMGFCVEEYAIQKKEVSMILILFFICMGKLKMKIAFKENQ